MKNLFFKSLSSDRKLIVLTKSLLKHPLDPFWDHKLQTHCPKYDCQFQPCPQSLIHVVFINRCHFHNLLHKYA